MRTRVRKRAGICGRVDVDWRMLTKRLMRTSSLTPVEAQRVVDFLRAPPGLGGEEGFWKGSTPFQVGAANPIEKSSSDGRFGSHRLSLLER